MTQVVLIGPVCSGKSTLLPLIAARLDRPAVDLDDIATPYYEEVGKGWDAMNEVGATLGDWGTYQWWQPGHVHAVRRVLEDHPDAVLALGAGHSVYADEALFDEVRRLLADRFTVLVLPLPDLDASVELLRERSRADREGMDWIMDGVDVLASWVKGPQNLALADLTVHTEGRTPDDVADEIVAAARLHETGDAAPS